MVLDGLSSSLRNTLRKIANATNIDKKMINEVAREIQEGLDLVPSFAVDGELKWWAERELPNDPYAFRALRDRMAELGYSYVVLDLAPGDSMLERQALSIADEVVLVAGPEYFAADGIEAADSTLGFVRDRLLGRFTADRLLVNRVHRGYAAHQVFAEEFARSGREIYVIGQSTAIHDCVMRHQTIWGYDPGNKHTSEYQRLAADLRG